MNSGRLILDTQVADCPAISTADPADCLLVAAARRENAVLVTHDRKILDYGSTGHVRVRAA